MVLVLPVHRVPPLVSVEVGAPPEGLSTVPALVRLLSGVKSLVDQKEGVITEGLATLATLVGLLWGVTALRDLEHTILTKRWPALWFSLIGMLLLVNNEG